MSSPVSSQKYRIMSADSTVQVAHGDILRSFTRYESFGAISSQSDAHLRVQKKMPSSRASSSSDSRPVFILRSILARRILQC